MKNNKKILNELNNLTEYQECCLLADYCQALKLTFSHLAQSTFTTNWAVKMKNSRMGVNRGVPDYLIIIPKKDKNILLFCEMKRKKGGVVSPEQKNWIEKINKTNDCLAFVAKGFEEAREKIKSLL